MRAAVGNLVPGTATAEWHDIVRSVLVDAGLRDTWTEQDRDGYLLLTFDPAVDAADVVDAVLIRLRQRAGTGFQPTVWLSPDLWRGPVQVRNTFDGEGTAVQAGIIVGDVVLPPTRQQLTALLDQLDRRRAATTEPQPDWTPRALERTVARTRPTPCFGRRRELAELRGALRRRQHVVLFGPVGVGKTTLLEHAAEVGVLSADTVRDCAGVVWPDDPVVSGAGLIRTLLSECYDVDPDTPVSQSTARRRLRSVRALVVLDGVDLSDDELRPVLNCMPRSVFVIASHRTDLWRLAVPLPVGRLPDAAGRALVEERLRRRLTAEEAAGVAEFQQHTDGHPETLCQLASHLREAGTHGTVGRIPTPAERPLIVPRLVQWLPAPGLRTLRTMAVVHDAAWGPELLTTLTGTTEDQGPEALLHAPLARRAAGRYRLLPEVLDHLPTDLPHHLDVTDQVTAWLLDAPGPRAVAGEIHVLDRLLALLIERSEFWTALIVARCASNRLTASGYGAAWGTVLAHGLRAAVAARSRPDEVYFRYALAVQRFEQGAHDEAVRYLTSVEADERPRVEAFRADVAAAEVLAPRTMADLFRLGVRTQWTKATRRIRHVPGLRTVVAFAEQSPTEFRALVSAVVAVVTAAALTAASAPPTRHPPVPAVALPPATAPATSTTPLPTGPAPTTPPSTATAAPPPASPYSTTTRVKPVPTNDLVPPPPSRAQPTTSTGPTDTCDAPWQLAGPWPYSLNAVAGSGDHDVWAAGSVTDGTSVRAVAKHWNGCHWVEIDPPNATDPVWLTGLAAPRVDLAWAVGATRHGTITETLVERWDGTAWSVVPSPSPGGATDELISVWAPNATEAWAVGSTETRARVHGALILHWDGSQWTSAQLPAPPGNQQVSLNGVSGTGPDDVWAVGSYELNGVYHPLVEHWDGHAWRLSNAPVGELSQVAARTPDDVWAVGVTTGPQPVVLHWNGAVWSSVPLTAPAGQADLSAAVPIGADDVWVFGAQGQPMHTLAEHWDGTGWHVVTTPADGRGGGFLLDAAAIGNRIWTVGIVGSDPYDSIVERLPRQTRS